MFTLYACLSNYSVFMIQFLCPRSSGAEVVDPFGDAGVAMLDAGHDGAVDGGEYLGVVDFAEVFVLAEGVCGVEEFALFAARQAFACEDVVHGGAQGVDVCPWAHVAVGVALLGGAEALRFYDVDAFIAKFFAGGSKVDEDGDALLVDEDVVGLDVAVKQFAFMQVVEGIEDADEQGDEGVLWDAALLDGVVHGDFAYGSAFDVLADVVGGVVGFKVGVYFGDVGVVEGGQEAHFAQEAAFRPVEGGLFAGVVDAEFVALCFAVAEGVGEAFFDDYFAVQDVFAGQVGDAKAS